MSNDKRKDERPEPRASAQGSSGRLAAAYDAVVTLLERTWSATDPVKKVCYDHMAGHYERKYRTKFPVHHTKMFYFDMALLTMLGAMGVTWFFADTLVPLVPQPQLVRIESVSPDTVVSGREQEYVYAYSNGSDAAVGCAILRVHLPPNTFPSDDVTEITPGEKVCAVDSTTAGRALSEQGRHDILIFTLNGIAPHSREEVRFRARSYGPTGESKTMLAEIVYWEESATAPSRVSSRHERDIVASALRLDITAPDAPDRGLPHEVSIAYANDGGRALNGAIVRVAVPEDFVVTGATPAFDGTNEWRLGDMPPEAAGTLVVRGYFRATAERLRSAPTFTVRGYVREAASSSNVLAEAVRRNVDPRAADLSFYQQIDEPSGRDTLLPGETVRVSVHYKNEGTRALQNLAITVDPGATFVTAVGGKGVDADGALARFDAASVPALAALAPGASGMVTASFTVKDVITLEDIGTAAFPALHVSSRGEYALADDADSVIRVDTHVADFAVATRLTADAAALYYTKDGDQLGVGPLPPTEGQPTKYRVFMTVSATTGGADGVTVEAVLPPNVAWSGRSTVTSGSSLDWLPSTRRVRWMVGNVPAFGGSATGQIGASFDVTLTPTAEDVGSAPVLLQQVRANGQDAATSMAIHATAATVTTDLPYDRRAAGMGVVVAAPATESGADTQEE